MFRVHSLGGIQRESVLRALSDHVQDDEFFCRHLVEYSVLTAGWLWKRFAIDQLDKETTNLTDIRQTVSDSPIDSVTIFSEPGDSVECGGVDHLGIPSDWLSLEPVFLDESMGTVFVT